MKGIKNNNMMQVINDLKILAIETKVPLWKRVAVEFEKPSRHRREMNIFKLDKYSKDGDVIIVPGKILGTGEMTKQITVAAISLSDTAKEKIIAAKGQIVSIKDLMDKNPKGSKIKILG